MDCQVRECYYYYKVDRDVPMFYMGFKGFKEPLL